jgi:hypothetical protein
MSDFNRRQFLKSLLGKLAQAGGTVVVATVAVATARAQGESRASETPAQDVQERADHLAAAGEPLPEDVAFEFLNGGFRNRPFGGFRNTPFGGFRNTPLGAFRNAPLGGFRNTPLGAFGNGGWPNGGWGGFLNGGWPNVGWRNWW